MLKIPTLEALKQVKLFRHVQTNYRTHFCSCLAENNLLKMVSENKANNSSNLDKRGNSNKKPEMSPPSNPAGSVSDANARYKKKLFADKNAATDPSQKTLVQSMIYIYIFCLLLFLLTVISVVGQSELLKGDKKEMDDSLFLQI